MPILLPAELHRFAMGCAEERQAQVLGDQRYDADAVARIEDLARYHRACWVLASGFDEGDNWAENTFDTVVGCDYGAGGHEGAAM